MKTFALAAAAAFIASAAGAATTVSITSGNTTDTSGWSYVTGEDFESATVGSLTGQTFAAGTFASLGGTGSGGTVDGTCPGDELCIRSGNVYGRVNTDPIGGSQYLDSNDTYGIEWAVSMAGAAFNAIYFNLIDGSDVGATVNVSSSLGGLSTYSGSGNGNVKTVLVTFDTWVTAATINILNLNGSGDPRINDGIGLDGIYVGRIGDYNIPGVPLPASALLLLGGISAFGVARKRRKAD